MICVTFYLTFKEVFNFFEKCLSISGHSTYIVFLLPVTVRSLFSDVYIVLAQTVLFAQFHVNGNTFVAGVIRDLC